MQDEDLKKAFDLFKLQGFETPEEMFLVGYLMAHGGELHFMEINEHDLELLEHNFDFWIPHVKDEQRIHRKVCEEEIQTARKLLKQLLEERKAKIPDWLEK